MRRGRKKKERGERLCVSLHDGFFSRHESDTQKIGQRGGFSSLPLRLCGERGEGEGEEYPLKYNNYHFNRLKP